MMLCMVGTTVNWLDFEVKKSEVKVTTTNVVILAILKVMRSDVKITDNLSGKGILVSCSPLKTI